MNLSAFNDCILFIVEIESFIYERDDESKRKSGIGREFSSQSNDKITI